VSAVPIKNKTSQTVVNALEHHILPFLPKLPDKILSDNGPEFASQLFTDKVAQYGIKHIFTTPYRPSSNGGIERVNRTIGEFLRSLTESSSEWFLNLTTATITYNNTKHAQLGVSVTEFLLGREHQVTDSILLPKDERIWRCGNPKFLPFSVGQYVM
jgi:transposase InsO family protein